MATTLRAPARPQPGVRQCSERRTQVRRRASTRGAHAHAASCAHAAVLHGDELAAACACTQASQTQLRQHCRAAAGDSIHQQPDPHEVLGVARGAGRAEIRSAYYARIQAAHPDVSGCDSTAEAVALNLAYTQLIGVRCLVRDPEQTSGCRAPLCSAGDCMDAPACWPVLQGVVDRCSDARPAPLRQPGAASVLLRPPSWLLTSLHDAAAGVEVTVVRWG